MDIITADFETFWSATHSLSKMSPIEYVMHPDTEIISVAVKYNGYPVDTIFGEDEIRRAFAKIDWSTKMVGGHNMSGFDAMIMAWRFGIQPKLWFCTLAMARPVFAKTVGLGLGKLVEHFGLGVKDNRALLATRGKKLADFTPVERRDMKKYNADDTDQCYALFHKLKGYMSPAEMLQVHMTINMLVNPQFEVDRPMLEMTLEEVRQEKRRSLLNVAELLGVTPERLTGKKRDTLLLETTYEADVPDVQHAAPVYSLADEDAIVEAVRGALASAPKFAQLLVHFGAEVPMKESKTTKNEDGTPVFIPALAKTDEGMQALLEHEDPIIATMAAARLGVKSTLLETRIEAFLRASNACGGRLPIPIRYCGADTTGRDSGEQYNPQNLPRINPSKPKLSDALRMSLCAPKGKVIGVADLSGIELRVNHFLWKVPYSMKLYKEQPDADLYRAAGAIAYACSPEDVTKEQRQLEKVKALGLGFGAGAVTFQSVAKTMGGVILTPEQAKDAVGSWRAQHRQIVNGWYRCQDILQVIMEGGKEKIDPWGLCTTSKEGILLPSGRIIRYPDLRQQVDEQTGRPQYVYGHGRHKAYIYGGKVDENCIAEGTLVLTTRGWVPIEAVAPSDGVHDGVEFVRHGGTVFKSTQQCVTVDGVYLTPDHEVLTNEGWKTALEKPEPFRPDLRGIDGAAPRGERREEAAMGVSVRVRGGNDKAGFGRDERGETRRNAKLWLHDACTTVGSFQNTRFIQAPGVCRMARYARSVSARVTSRLQKLRRAWDYCVQGMAGELRGVLGRHGSVVLTGTHAGAQRQQRRILENELYMGDARRAKQEPSHELTHRGHSGTVPAHRSTPLDAVLPTPTRASARRVYDIINAGPRHRFVVLGERGPFIVHNCVQALARDVCFGYALEFYKQTKLMPALRVHDELVYVFPESEAADLLALLQSIMRTPPKWWPELVTWSEGDIANRYGEAK